MQFSAVDSLTSLSDEQLKDKLAKFQPEVERRKLANVVYGLFRFCGAIAFCRDIFSLVFFVDNTQPIG